MPLPVAAMLLHCLLAMEHLQALTQHSRSLLPAPPRPCPSPAPCQRFNPTAEPMAPGSSAKLSSTDSVRVLAWKQFCHPASPHAATSRTSGWRRVLCEPAAPRHALCPIRHIPTVLGWTLRCPQTERGWAGCSGRSTGALIKGEKPLLQPPLFSDFMATLWTLEGIYTFTQRKGSGSRDRASSPTSRPQHPPPLQHWSQSSAAHTEEEKPAQTRVRQMALKRHNETWF